MNATTQVIPHGVNVPAGLIKGYGLGYYEASNNVLSYFPYDDVRGLQSSRGAEPRGQARVVQVKVLKQERVGQDSASVVPLTSGGVTVFDEEFTPSSEPLECLQNPHTA